MLDWLMRKLPKRVLKVGDMYRPQVWLLWWHGIYDGEAVSPLEYEKLEDAVWVLANRWSKRETPKKSVVWRGC